VVIDHLLLLVVDPIRENYEKKCQGCRVKCIGERRQVIVAEAFTLVARRLLLRPWRTDFSRTVKVHDEQGRNQRAWLGLTA
jgi:hypothetical protein